MRVTILLTAILILLALPLLVDFNNPNAAAAAAASRAAVLDAGNGAGVKNGDDGGSKIGGGSKAQTADSETEATGSKTQTADSKTEATGSKTGPEDGSDSPQAGGADKADVYASPFGDEPRPAPVVGKGGYLENGWLIWEELMPADWDPVAIFEELNINDMEDGDPRIDQIIETFVAKWNAAPVNSQIDKKAMRIPGFVVPLDFEADKLSEFFLVPFFGACIHVPPPPPNQIILVRLKKPMAGLGAMEVVEVYGRISVEGFTTDLGSAGYTLAADKVEYYQFPEDDG